MNLRLFCQVVLLSALFFFSCDFFVDDSYQNKIGGKFIYSEIEPFQTFNVHAVSHPASEKVLGQIFEGLVKFHPKELAVIPCIADKYQVSADNLTYTFQIKENVFFHDNKCFQNSEGRELTVDDIVYSFERICHPKTHSPAYVSVFKNIVKGAEAYYKGKAKTISGIVAKENTLTIQLITPNPAFLEKLASINCAIVPKEGIVLYGNENPVGTGPYSFFESKNLEKVILIKNQRYHMKDENGHRLPFIDSLEVLFGISHKKALQNYINGSQNALLNIPVDFVEKSSEQIKEEKKEEINIVNIPLLSTSVLEMNTLHPLLKNIHLRRAINYALDKNRLSNIIFGDVHEKAGEMGITHPGVPYYRCDRIKGYSFDLTKAKEELLLSGLADSLHLLSFVFTVNNNDYKSVKVAEEIVLQLKTNLGIELKLNLLSYELKSKLVNYGRSDISLNNINAKFTSPEAFLVFYYGRDISTSINEPSYPNTSRYQNDKFDFSFERGRKSNNQEEAFRNFLIAENQLIEDATVAVLWYENYHCIYPKKLKNLHLNSLSFLDLSEVYWEK